jgi:hypothetical protein
MSPTLRNYGPSLLIGTALICSLGIPVSLSRDTNDVLGERLVSWNDERDSAANWGSVFEELAADFRSQPPTDPLGVRPDVFTHIAKRFEEASRANAPSIGCVDSTRAAILKLATNVETVTAAMLGENPVTLPALSSFASEVKGEYREIYEATGLSAVDSSLRLESVLEPYSRAAEQLIAAKQSVDGELKTFVSARVDREWRRIFECVESCASAEAPSATSGVEAKKRAVADEARAAAPTSDLDTESIAGTAEGDSPADESLESSRLRRTLLAAARVARSENVMTYMGQWCDAKWQLRAGLLCDVTADALRHLGASSDTCSCDRCASIELRRHSRTDRE